MALHGGASAVAGSGGIGNVSGPASSTDGAAALFNGTDGKTLKDSKIVFTVPAAAVTVAFGSGTTLTFPNTSATIARTDAAQTFTGIQTFTSDIIAGGTISALNTTAIADGGSTGSGFKFSSATNFGMFFGSGAPTISAATGSIYLRSDGSTVSNRLYVNTNGGGTWTAVTTIG